MLASLNPSDVAAADVGDAVRIDGVSLSRSDLVGAATSVAERVAGAGRVAVLATPTASTVLAITDAGLPASKIRATPSGGPVHLGSGTPQPQDGIAERAALIISEAVLVVEARLWAPEKAVRSPTCWFAMAM